MKSRLIALFLILTSVAFGQINFEKGYFIDNNNHRIDCFIQNYDWESNPVEFAYQINEKDRVQMAGIASVKEFGILGESKFIRANIKIDRSPAELENLSDLRNPEWSQEQLFLKILLEGKASLYYFQDRNLRRFFYSVSDSMIQQLISKEYLVGNGNYSNNSDFRYQLSKDLMCKNNDGNPAEKVQYDINSLLDYFKSYNTCNGNPFTIYETITNKGNFVEGYIVDNNKQKTNCLLRRKDWENNPTEIEYLLNEHTKPIKGNTSTIKEFGVPGSVRFIRADIKIDRSTSGIADRSYLRNPVWLQEQLFLKVLLYGKASLYSYQDHYINRYFYSVNDSAVQQLIFKEYLDQNANLKTNLDFRYQLSVDIKCPRESKNPAENVDYDKKSLLRYFTKYNDCEGDTSIEFREASKADNKINIGNRETLKLRVKPGLNYSDLKVWNNFDIDKYSNFNNQTNFRLGFEAEYILPFNKNKWGILFEPTFQYFNTQSKNSIGIAELHFHSLEIPFGIRHYYFLTNSNKLYLNAFYIPSLSVSFNSTLKISNVYETTIYKIKSNNSLAFGLGFEYKKLSVEVRYYTQRDLLRNYSDVYTSYRRISIILGIMIL